MMSHREIWRNNVSCATKRPDLQSWSSVNLAVKEALNDNKSSKEIDGYPDLLVHDTHASKHRNRILQAATNLNKPSKGRVSKRSSSTRKNGLEKELKQVYNHLIEDGVRDVNEQTVADSLVGQHSTSKKASIKHYLELSKESKLNMQRFHRPKDVGQESKKFNVFARSDENLDPEISSTASVQPELSEQTDSPISKLNLGVGLLFAEPSITAMPKLVATSKVVSSEHSNGKMEQIRSDMESYDDCDDGSLEGLLAADDALLDLPSNLAFSVSQKHSKKSAVTETSVDQLQPAGFSMSPAPASKNCSQAFMRRSCPTSLSQSRSLSVPCMTPSLRIMTCFRVAGALRELKDKSKHSFLMIELYAIATRNEISTGEEDQAIRFADIFFPQRPPYIIGTSRRRSEQTPQHLSASHPNLNDTGVSSSTTTSLSACQPGILVRAMIRPSTSLPRHGARTNVDNGCSKGLSVGSGRVSGCSQLGDMAHVSVEAVHASDWEEVEHVRGIVDPDEVQAEKS